VEISTLFSHKPHVVVHDFTEFSINAEHFQLFEGKSKKTWVVLRTGKKSTWTGTGPRLRTTGIEGVHCWLKNIPHFLVQI